MEALLNRGHAYLVRPRLVRFAVPVPVDGVLHEFTVLPVSQVLDDVDLDAGARRFTDRPAHRRRLKPEGRPVADLLLELHPDLEVAVRRFEAPLRTDHAGVVRDGAVVARHARGRDRQVSVAVERDRIRDVDRVPPRSG